MWHLPQCRAVGVNQQKHPSSNSSSNKLLHLPHYCPAQTRAVGSRGRSPLQRDQKSIASSTCLASGCLTLHWSTVSSTAASVETPAWLVRHETIPHSIFSIPCMGSWVFCCWPINMPLFVAFSVFLVSYVVGICFPFSLSTIDFETFFVPIYVWRAWREDSPDFNPFTSRNSVKLTTMHPRLSWGVGIHSRATFNLWRYCIQWYKCLFFLCYPFHTLETHLNILKQTYSTLLNHFFKVILWHLCSFSRSQFSKQGKTCLFPAFLPLPSYILLIHKTKDNQALCL